MDDRTHARGWLNTRARKLWVWLAISALLHLPFSPLVGLLGVFQFLKLPSNDDEPVPELREIPIDVLTDAPESAPAPPAPPPNAAEDPAEAVPIPKPKPKPKPKTEPAIVDAGAPDAAADDAGAPDAGDAGVSEPKDAGVADAGPSDAGAPLADAGAPAGQPKSSLGDPVALAGGSAKVVDANANVRLIIDTEKLRALPLGARVGALLGGIEQWRDFFAPTGLNPVRDIDRILIVGPQLRRSAEVVAIIQHHLGRPRMRAALDQLVRQQPAASWLPDAGVPVAVAQADRAQRFFVMPSSHLIIVSPESTRASAERIGAKMRLPALPGDVIVVAHVATPWRAVRGLPFRVPESISWARAQVTPTAGGGAHIDIDAEDGSADEARKHAPELERAITAATQLDLGLLGDLLGTKPTRFVQTVRFWPAGARIHGELELTPEQVSTVFDFAEAYALPPAPRASSGAARRPR